MKKLSCTSGFLITAFLFLAAVPLWADGVDEKIKALEEELGRLKQEQAQVKAEQMELKKEAAAAAAALPSFSYRPGNGVLVEAADKSWSLRFSIEADYHIVFNAGKDETGRTQGEVMGRRFRPQINYCLNDCFYEIEMSLDLDGFATNSALQRGAVYINFQNMNPYLPQFYFAMDGPADVNSYQLGSSATSAQLEYPLLARNNGYNTGRFGNGLGLRWENLPLSPLIPGRARITIAMGNFGEGDDGNSSTTDRKDFSAHIQLLPFTELKNYWLSGFGFSMLSWFCNNDTAGTGRAAETGSACNRLRIRDDGPGGRQTLFDTGAGIGRGLAHYLSPGVGWRIGPYQVRGWGGFWRFEDEGGTPGRKKANAFLIAHELNVWSPQGLFTGSSRTPGTLYVGTMFERTDVSCGIPGCDASGEFSRNRILRREWDIWYVLGANMNIGVAVFWYDASNLSTAAQSALNIRGDSKIVAGKGGDWVDWFIVWRWRF